MMDMTAGEVAEAVGGKLLCGRPDTPLRHVSIDSRSMQGDDLFVPITGAKVDAHRFIGKALETGAAATFTSHHDEAPQPEENPENKPFIRVPNTLKALQALGAVCRSRMKMPFIGITGSVGKTSTREMITAALAAGRKVTGTAGNSNGQIGVPLTLTELDDTADIAVMEMGMSLPGEMAVIAAIARPDMAVVTNIGVSHIENLGSQEKIREEKLHITDGFTRKNAVLLNGDDALLGIYRGTKAFRPVFCGLDEENEYRAEAVRTEAGRTLFTAVTPQGCVELSLGVPGLHNVRNALMALAAAAENGVALEPAAEALARYEGFARRLQILTDRPYTIIDDSYNASPDSMKAALDVLAAYPTSGRRLAVLADMLELGVESPLYHYQVGKHAARCGVQMAFLIGDQIRNAGRALEEQDIPTAYFSSNEAAALALAATLKPGDTVLIKGSNGMKLGELLKEL